MTAKKKYLGGRNYWFFRETEPLDRKSDPLAQPFEPMERVSDPMDHFGGRPGSRTTKAPWQPKVRKPKQISSMAWLRAADAARLLPYSRPVNHSYRPGPVNVVQLRQKLNLTQIQFARRFGFPLGTLRHWENGTRRPRGAALILLNVIWRDPAAVMRALRPDP